VKSHLGEVPLRRVVNTHLHSDHCGGNAALQVAWGVAVTVPSASFDAASRWDEELLTFQSTRQSCPRFRVDGQVRPGERLRLGGRAWEVLGAMGHDPDAIMLFEPLTRTLISGDALWENRLAINFPELVGDQGFADARQALDTIESLSPRWVIPGHGRPFCDVASALRSSRERLDLFEQNPGAHTRHALRALAMFRMLEIRVCSLVQFEEWMSECPIFVSARRAQPSSKFAPSDVIDSLIRSGSLKREDDRLELT